MHWQTFDVNSVLEVTSSPSIAKLTLFGTYHLYVVKELKKRDKHLEA